MKPTLFFGPMYFSMIEGFSIKDYFSHGLKISELDLYHLIRQRNFNKIEKDTLASLDESIVFENAFFMHNYLTLSVYYRDLNASLYFVRNFPIFEPDNHNKVINILAKEIKDLPNWTEVYESLERFIASQDRLMPYSDAELVLLAEMESKYQLDFIEYYSKYFEGCSSSEINETLVNVMTSFDRSQFGFSKSFDFWRNYEDELLGYLDMIDHQDPGIKERMLIAFGEDKAAKTTELSEDQIALIEESSKLIYQGDYEGSLATLVAAIGDDEASKDIVLNQAILLGKEIGDIRKILRKGAKFNIGSFYASFSHEIEYMKELKQEGMDVMSFIGISDAVEYIFRHGEKEPFLFLVDDGVLTSDFTSNINFLDLALDSVFVSDENLFFLEILKAYGVIDVNSINQNKLERIKVLDRNLYDKVYNILFK